MGKDKNKMKNFGEGLNALQNVPVEPQPVEMTEEELKALVQKGQQALEKADEVGEAFFQQLEIVRNLELQSQGMKDLPEVQLKLQRANDYLSFHLNNQNSTIRRAAHISLIQFYIGQAGSKEQLKSVLKNLLEKEVIVKATGGKLYCLGERYNINTKITGIEPGLGEEEVRDLFEAANKKSRQEMIANEHEMAEEWAQKATLTITDLMSEQAGQISFGIYMPTFTDQRGSEHRPRSGVIFAESKNGLLRPISGTGDMRPLVNSVRMACNGRGLPSFKISDFKVADPRKDTEKPLLSLPRISKEDFNVALALYWAFRWGIYGGAIFKPYQIITSHATISSEEFFLKRKHGAALLEFFGWNTEGWMEGEDDKKQLYPHWVAPNGRRIPAIFCLVDRYEEDGQNKLRLNEIPEHLTELFGNCDSSYPDDFNQCPQPLSRILAAMYGEAVKKAKRTTKQGRINDVDADAKK